MQNYNLSPANMQLIEKMKDQNPKRERERVRSFFKTIR